MANNIDSRLINQKIKEISGHKNGLDDLELLTSVQKARLLSWLESSNIDLDILDNNQKSSSPNSTVIMDDNVENEEFHIGIDIQNIDELFQNIEGDLKTNSDLINIFNEAELIYAESKKNTHDTLAGIFSLKEAIIKTGLVGNEIKLKDIVIEHNEDGKPIYKNFSTSISHSKNMVIAVAASKPKILFSETNLKNYKNSSDSFEMKSRSKFWNFLFKINILITFLIVAFLLKDFF